MRKITQTIVGTTPPLDKNVIWLDSTDNTAPVEKVFINGQWTPMGIDTDDYYTKEEVNDKLDEKLDVIETPVNGNLIAMDSQGQAIDSGKKTTDFIANPASEGQEGEVLSVDSEGNPVWTTVTPTGTADTEMSDTSTNAVQNKIIKSYVDDNCAKKDGYYSTLTAGAAENLVGQTVDSEAYLIRPTGGDSNEVANGVASVLGMEGNSAVWNQLVQNGDFSNGTNSWFSRLSGGISVSASNTGLFIKKAANNNNCISNEVQIVAGHKYLFSFDVRNINGSILVKKASNNNLTTNAITIDASVHFEVGRRRGRIFTGAETDAYIGFNYVNAETELIDSTVLEFDNVTLHDLTLLGIDNLTTVAEVEEWLAQHVGTKPYYTYNAGEILSAKTLGMKTYGQNLLNPTTRQAKLIPYTWVEDGITYSNQYTVKNIPSGATATFTPDNTGVAESVTITDNVFDITSYGSGILELSAATANTYVCMKWDEDKDDDIVPFEDHTYDFDVRKVYGKVSGAGSYVQCFQNGIMGAGSIHDMLTSEKAVVNVGRQDLGAQTMSWGNDSTLYYTTSLAGKLKPSTGYNSSRTTGIICSKYVTNPAHKATSELVNGEMLRYNNGYLYIKDTGSYADAAAFKAALSGVYLNYELATPITYTDLIYRDGGIDRPLADVLMNITVNNWSMEEQLMTPYENGNPTSISAKITTQYGMDAVEEIDTIKHTYVSAYTEQNFNDSQKAQARRNIGAVEEDGSYPNMSVGIAKNLAGENAVEAEYTYRPSNGTIGTDTGIANVTTVKGKTLKWQQIVSIKNATYTTTGQVITSNSSNQTIKTTISGTTSSSNTDLNQFLNSSISLKITSKYFVGVKLVAGTVTSGTFGLRFGGYNDTYDILIDNNDKISSKIIQPGADIAVVIWSSSLSGTTPEIQINIFDLTDLFGAGNEPNTVAEFEAMYPLNYYAYTETPVLINNAASGIVTTGFNQWDEEWEVGSIDINTGEKTYHGSKIRSKNYIKVFPSTSYYLCNNNTANSVSWYVCFYSADGNYLGYTTTPIKNTIFTTPANCGKILFRENGSNYGITYKNDICINLSDTAKNGTYEPYEKHTFYFDKVLQSSGSLATVTGKLNGEGESVTVFPDGLKSAGTVYDEIKGNVAIKRIGSVDLGDLTWNYSSSYGFYSTGIANKVNVGVNTIAYNLICSNFIAMAKNSLTTSNNGIAITDSKAIAASSTMTDPATFKAAMNGVILYYELATPETYILDQTVTGGYQVNALGTEQRLPEDTASAVNAPVRYSVVYPIDAVGTITKLPINYISEKSLTNFTTELASKLGTFLSATIGVTATYNQTTQEYDYSITITSNE